MPAVSDRRIGLRLVLFSDSILRASPFRSRWGPSDPSRLTGINTAPLGSSTVAQTFQNGQFGLTGNSGQIATTETEPRRTLTAPPLDRDGWHGDAFTSSFTGVPFANGNTTVSLQRVVSIVVIPNLHVSATGSSLGGHGCGISTSSAGSDSFSDRLSITEAQLDAVNKAIGSHYGDIFVKLNISSQVR